MGKKEKKSLKDALGQIAKKFKKENPDITYDPTKKVDAISSGNFIFDLVTSVGGFPRRRLTEVFGMEHSGKTSICLSTCAKLQRDGGRAIFLDFEGTFDEAYARDIFGLEVDNETFTVLYPNTAEEGDGVLDILEENLDRVPDLIVVDSIDAMKPEAVVNSSLTDKARVGAHAQSTGRMITRFRKLAKVWDSAFVLINQMRMTMGTSTWGSANDTLGSGTFGDSHVTTGGYAVRFYSSVRMYLKCRKRIAVQAEDTLTGEMQNNLRIGQVIDIENIKNKVGTPFLKGQTFYHFAAPGRLGGFSEERDLINLLESRGRIKRASAGSLGSRLSLLSEDGSSVLLETVGVGDLAEVEMSQRKDILDPIKQSILESMRKRRTLLDILDPSEVPVELLDDGDGDSVLSLSSMVEPESV